MIAPLVVCLYILLFSFLLSRFTGSRILEVAPFSLFFAMLWMTLFGISNNLEFGANALLPFSVAFGLIVWISRKKHLEVQELKELISFPIILFVVAVFWTFSQASDMQFAQWDEFTHWGFAVKSIFTYDVLLPLSPVPMDGQTYPPGLALLGYLSLKINSSWSEGIVFWSYHVLFLTLIFAIIAKIKFKNYAYVITGIVLLTLSSIIFYDFFQTVYADPILSLVFGYSLFLATDRQTNKSKIVFLNFCLTNVALFLIKDIGIILGIISALVFFFNSIFEPNTVSKSALRKIFSNTFKLIFAMLLMLITRNVWLRFASNDDLGSSVNLANPESLCEVKALLLGNCDSGTLLWTEFINALRNRDITFWNGINLSTFDWLLIFSVFFLFYIFQKKGLRNKINWIVNSMVILIASFVYFGSLFVAYMTVFGSTGSTFPSIDRYVNTYLSGVLFFIAILAVKSLIEFNQNLVDGPKSKIPTVSFALAFLLLFYSPQGRLVQYVKKPAGFSQSTLEQFKNIKTKVELAGFTESDSIYVITQHRSGYEYYYLNYIAFPGQVSSMPFSIGSEFGELDFYTDSKINSEKWDEILSNFDFVIIYNVSDSFVNEYRNNFKQPDKIEEQTIYFVEHSESGNLLVKYI